jgi:hypothetical protein
LASDKKRNLQFNDCEKGKYLLFCAQAKVKQLNAKLPKTSKKPPQKGSICLPICKPKSKLKGFGTKTQKKHKWHKIRLEHVMLEKM